MRKLFLSVIGCLLLVSSGFGFSFTLYDFGATPFDYNNNWSPISYPYGIGHQPSPGPYGEGGEKFDLEGLKVAWDEDYVYLALANSFGYYAHSTAWNETYRLGDLFIGIDNKYQYAIDVTNSGSTGLYEVSSWNGLQDVPGSYYGTPLATQLGAHEMVDGIWLGDVTTANSFWEDFETGYPTPGHADTYVREFCFEKSLLGSFNSLEFHINLGCGNDLMENTVNVIPEPTTLLLLGLGLIGCGAALRRK